MRRSIGMGGLAVALATMLQGGAVLAAILDSSVRIHGCYKANNGQLGIVENASDCGPSEQAIAWD